MISGRRTRVLVAVGVIVAAAVGTFGVLRVTRATDDDRAAAVRARLRPAAEALRAADRPADFRACTNRPDADLCWDGQGSEVAAVRLLVSALDKAGATGLTPHCVRKGPQQRVLCRVDGSLKGASLDSLVSADGGHLRVVVFAATQPPPDILQGGTPVSLSH